MKNQPNRIYLQTGLEDNAEMCADFNELDGISWCADKIYNDDLQFISIDFIFSRIKELETDKYIDSEHKKQRIKELKNLLK